MSRHLVRRLLVGRRRNPLPPLVRAGPAPVLGLDELAVRILDRPSGPEQIALVLALRAAAVGTNERRHAADSGTVMSVGGGGIVRVGDRVRVAGGHRARGARSPPGRGGG